MNSIPMEVIESRNGSAVMNSTGLKSTAANVDFPVVEFMPGFSVKFVELISL